MFATLATVLLVPGQVAKAVPVTPTEILEAAIAVRDGIRTYDIEAEIESIQYRRVTKETTKLSKHFRTVASDGKFRSDSEHYEWGTKSLLKQRTVCKGCVSDAFWYLRDHFGGTTTAAADATPAPFQEFAIDLRAAGYEFNSIENLSRERKSVILRSTKYEAPTRDTGPPDGVIVLKRKQVGTNYALHIHIDPKLGYAITRMEFSSPGDTLVHSVMTLHYGEPRNGIYFPTRYTQEYHSKDLELKETAKLTVHRLNEPVDSTLFSAEALGLKFNALVVLQEMQKDKMVGVTRFYDGNKLVRSPPNPAEYFQTEAEPELPARPIWPTLLYWTGVGVLAVAGVFFIRYGRRWRQSP